MTTSEKRDFTLTLLQPDSFIDFIKRLSPKDFVELHQNTFKDHYLGEPEVLVDDSLFDDLDLFDIISDKYRQFFNDLGLRASHRWLNPSFYSNYSMYLRTEDFSIRMILTEVEGDFFSEEISERSSDYFSELYYEMVSRWSLSQFILDLYELYLVYKNEEAA